MLWADADAASRDAMLTATAALVRALGLVNAHHEDLNAKNVYLVREGQGWRAYALDVDRVRFLAPGDGRAAELNLARLERSLKKGRQQFGLVVSDDDLRALQRRALGAL